MTDAPVAFLGLDPETRADLFAAIPGLHRWYHTQGRDLPWRRTTDPYAIWISEVMLQQTRVTAVVPYYHRWLARLPTVGALAEAPLEEVLKLWEGLGYYSRARNLHRAARAVVEDWGGTIPADPDAFAALPGVGTYTTAAVLSIAFGADLAVVDGNVRRVLCRLVALEADPRRAPHAAALDRLAQDLLPVGTAADHNQAMMELGATLCTPKVPGCSTCPLTAVCSGRALGDPERYPVRRPRTAVPHHDVALGIVFHDGRVFIDRRPYGGLLGGLWEFPGGKVEPGETVEQALHRELAEEFGLRVRIDTALEPVAHAYSHFKVTLHPRLCTYLGREPRVGEGNPWKWVTPAALEDHPMPRGNRKVLEQLQRSRGDDRTTPGTG
ncbi:MAG: A/G-specific adenine glycosylase [Deferrisomatales bacterium]|nr:A/G-specific adenine glycosylase [Deferrisomatales bacterium]